MLCIFNGKRHFSVLMQLRKIKLVYKYIIRDINSRILHNFCVNTSYSFLFYSFMMDLVPITCLGALEIVTHGSCLYLVSHIYFARTAVCVLSSALQCNIQVTPRTRRSSEARCRSSSQQMC
jgi:hypothetical protein